MNISLNQTDSNNATLTVSLSEQDYSEKLNNKIKEYSKKAQLKGFRPGKVPAGLIQKMYGKSLLVEQINELLAESVNGYLRENNLRILGEPLPNRNDENKRIDWDNQKSFEFTYDLGLVPDFELNLGDIQVEGVDVTIDEATLQQTYDYIQKQNGKMINPEVSEEGDFLYGELKQLSSEFETKTLLPLNQVKDGLEKFIGVKPGDLLFFDIRKTFGYDDSAIAHVTGLKKEIAKDLQGEFEFVVERINRTEPVELNQELFDKILGPGAVSSELEFRDKVVLLVDDSIVRGTTSKQIIQMARDAGARKVYFASAAPPVRYPNVYGIDMPAPSELIANGRTEDEVEKLLGADWLIYQDLDDLVEAVAEGNENLKAFDTSCFSGEYVTGLEHDYLGKIAEARSDVAKAERRKAS